MAKTSKFGLGVVPFKVVNGHFPGVQATKTVNRVVRPGLLAEDNDYEYEFGEIVEIVKDTKSNWIVKPIDGDTTAESNLAVILRELTGGVNVNQKLIFTAKDNVAINLFDLQENIDAITVSLQGETDPDIGDTVHVGTGLEDTIAGAVYGAQVGTTGTIELPNLKFDSEVTVPSTTDSRTITIKKL